jgi:predicted dehydrogenase
MTEAGPKSGGSLRIGLIGAARVAPYAIVTPIAETPRASLVAVASRDSQRAHNFAAEHGVPRVFAGYGELINAADIDLVYIATPPAFHAGIAARAIDAGKHVLIEKPFAMCAMEAHAILEQARASGVRAFEAMHAPHHAMFRRIAAMVESGVLGRIRRVESFFSTRILRAADEFRWRRALGGGALMDLGVYPLTFCRRLLGEDFELDSVSVRMEGDVDASLRAELRFAGVEVVIGASMDQAFDAFLSIEGEKGSIHASNPIVPHLGSRVVWQCCWGSGEQQFEGPSSWTAQLQAICSTLIDGATFPVPEYDPAASMAAIDRIRACFP